MAGSKIEYGLLGHPLGHSFSRTFFNNKFEREGIDAEYLNFDLSDITLLPQVLQEHPQLRGLNVTIPYKEKVIPYLTELSDEARAIGAVNVIKILPPTEGRKGGLYGFNSDIIGFKRSIQPLLEPHHKKALILGTGGASKAIRMGLEQLGLEWSYVSRQRPLVPAGSEAHSVFTYSDLTPDLLQEYTVIVNCTPLGMYPRTDSCPDIPYRALTPMHLLYDLVYNPDVTLFMQQGRRSGAKVKNGLDMLHLQAIASWEFWG